MFSQIIVEFHLVECIWGVDGFLHSDSDRAFARWLKWLQETFIYGCLSLRTGSITPAAKTKRLRNCFSSISWMCVYAAAAAAKSLQLCLTLCDPIDGSPPGSAIPGILQARTLEWVAIAFSNAWKWKVKVKLLSCIRLLVTSWTTAYQAPPSMGFSRQ